MTELKKGKQETNNMGQKEKPNDGEEKNKNEKNHAVFREVVGIIGKERAENEVLKFQRHFELLMSLNIDELRSVLGSVSPDSIDDDTRKKTSAEIDKLEKIFLSLKIQYLYLKGRAHRDIKNVEKDKEKWGSLIGSVMEFARTTEDVGRVIHEISGKKSLAYLVAIQVVQEYIENPVENFISGLLPNLHPSAEKTLSSIEAKFDSGWKAIEEKLEKAGKSKAEIESRKIKFRSWITKTEMGENLLRRMTMCTLEEIPSFLIMAFYLHGAPDKKKAVSEYVTFMVAADGLQKAFRGIMKMAISMRREAPQMAKLAIRCMRFAKSPAGMLTATALIASALFIPGVGEAISKVADWGSEQFDDDNIFWKSLNIALKTADLPFTYGELFLQDIGVISLDPRRDQMEYLKDFVANKNGLLGVEDMIVQYNSMIEKKSKEGNLLGKIWNHYRIDDIQAWSKRQIPEYYSRSSHILSKQKTLETSLRELIDPTTKEPILGKEEHLSYYQSAIDGTVKSNAANVSMVEERENVERKIQNFFVFRLFDSRSWYKGSREQEKKFDDAKKLWYDLKNSANELGREVDVYKSLKVYDEKIWNDPTQNDKRADAYIERLLWEESISDDLKIIQDANESVSHQAHDITMLLVSEGEQKSFFDILFSALGESKDKIMGKDVDDMRGQKAHEVRQHLSFVMQSLTRVRSQEWINNIIENHLTSHIISGEPITLETFKNLIGIITEKHLRDGENIQYKCTEDQSRHEIYIKEQWDDHDTELKNSITIDTHNTSDTSKWEVRMIWDYRGDAFGISKFGTMKNGREGFETMRKKISWVEFVGQYGDKIDKSGAKKIIEENLMRLKKNDEDVGEREKREEEERRKQRELFERAKTDPEAFHELHKNDRKVEMDGIIIYFSDKDIFRGAVMKEENRKVKSEKKGDYIWYYPEDDDEPMRCSYITPENAIRTLELNNIKHLSGLSVEEQRIIRFVLCTPQKDGLEKMIRLSERHIVIHGWGEKNKTWEDYGIKLFEKLEPIYEKTSDKKKFLENLLQKLEEKGGITVHNWEEFITEK